MFAKQFYWYKLGGLLFKLRRPRAFQLSLCFGCILIGWLQVTWWGRGIPPFQGKPKPRSGPPASPGSPTISATLDDVKGQIKAMSDDNLPFWTSVLSWVKGDWWKTIFTIVIVALRALLCGPFILQCIMNFVTQRLVSFSQIGGRRVRVQYIPMNDAHTMS